MTAALLVVALLVAPVLRASPTTDLVDGQFVRVRGTGYPAGATVEVRQCVAGFDGQEDCYEGNVRFATADRSGAFAAAIPVRRVITTPSDPRVDCAAEKGLCVVAAFPVGEPAEGAATALGFDPDVPAMAPLQVEFTVDPVHEVDPRTGDARVTGTIRCSRPAAAIVEIELNQVRDGRLLVAVDGADGVCGHDVRAWSVTVDSGRHAFRPGDAFVESFADVSTAVEATGATVNTGVTLRDRDP